MAALYHFYSEESIMATFSGNAAGYRIDLVSGRVRVVDIDASDGDTGSQTVKPGHKLHFDDGSFRFSLDYDAQVNTTTHSSQFSPATAGLMDGGHIVTWTSNGQDGSGYGVYAQRYDADGNKLGGEMQINTTTHIGQAIPDVTALADGGFVITWLSNHQDGSSTGIFAQRYDAAGSPVGGEVQINTYTDSQQVFPQIAGLADGGYVITWASWAQDGSAGGVYAQRYDAAGNAVGGEIQVNTTTLNDQLAASITALADGGYVISWSSDGQDGDLFGIYAQRYDAAGNAIGGEVQVNTETLDEQFSSKVTALQDGGFVITWTSGGHQDGAWNGIFAQRYDVNGAAVGTEIQVNTSNMSDQHSPAVAGLNDGGYVVVWKSEAPDNSFGICAQRFDAAGNAVGGEIAMVGSDNWFYQEAPDVTALANGGFLVTWESYGQDGSGAGIFARRFDANGDSVATDMVLTGGRHGDVINAGAGMQLIRAMDGDDVVDGGSGDDVLYGFGGQDSLVGGKGSDVLDGGQDNDTLIDDRGDDALSGGSGDDYLQAGWGNDFLNGGSGDDILRGGTGDDLLNGNAGADILTGNEGYDIFKFADFLLDGVDIDTITDFNSGVDIIQLGQWAFDHLSLGALRAGQFTANDDGEAQDGNDYIIYESDTGNLYYDEDGNGAGAKLQFAVIGVGTHPLLTAADFVVI